MDGYERIRAAVIRKAMSDYLIALKTKNLHAQKSLERFFLSDWGELLSYGHGEYIIEWCKKRIENN